MSGEDGYEYGTYDAPAQVDPAPSVSISSVGGGNEFGPTPEQTAADKQAKIDAVVAASGDTTFSEKALTENTAKNAAINDAVSNSGDTTFTSKALTGGTAATNNSTLGRDSNTIDSTGSTGGNAGDKVTAAQTSKPADSGNFLNDVIKNGVAGGVAGYLAGTGIPGLTSGYPNFSSAAGVQILNQGTASGYDTSASLLNSQNNPVNLSKSNILHNYVTPTYRISLYAITKNSVNQLYDGISPGSGKSILNGAECIIADSGINASKRSKDFPVDMGIDNLELESIVGAQTRTRNTDVIHIKFDIIEPYTAVLFARMRKLNARFNPNGGWNTMFFCLMIEWFGYNDSGQPVVIPRQRYIPFTFVNMKMKVNNAGAVYNCTAIPASNTALSLLDNTIPFHVELQGSTIKDIFNAQAASYVSQASGSGTRDSNTTVTTGQTGGNATSTSTVNKGLAEALNYSQKELCDKRNNGQSKPNQFIFEFDPALSNATISNPAKFKEQSLAMSSGKGNEQATAIKNGKAGVLTLDTTKDVFRAQSGTKITDLINACLGVSSYMTKQWKPGGGDNQTPLNLWKIIPSVKYLDIDPSTNYYQRIIKYSVIPYSLKGQDAPNFPNGVPNDNEVMRQYNYIFTGQNRDVISVDLDFKMSFFEVRNGTPTNAVVNANDSPNPDQNSPNNYLQTKTTGGFKPRYHFSHGLANRQNTGATADTYADIDVQNLMEKIFDNGVDLLNLNIEIVGDPDWISQDNMLYGTKAGNASQLIDHSINFSKEQYFDFFFFSPSTDYNDSSGLFGADGDYADFSGRYRVISVKSKFSGGKFTQQLKNVRLRNQTASTSGSNRVDTINTDSIGSSGGSGSTSLPGTSGSYGLTGSNNIRALAVGLGGRVITNVVGGAVNSIFSTTNKSVPNNSKSGDNADTTIQAPDTDTGSKKDPVTGAAVPKNSGYIGDGSTVVKGSQGYVGDGSTTTGSQGYVGDGSNDPKVIDKTTIGNGGYNPNEPESAAGKTMIDDQGNVVSREIVPGNNQYWEPATTSNGYSEDFAYNGTYGDTGI